MNSIVEVLRRRAEQHGERALYGFLGDGVHESGRLTFADADRCARAFAVRLRASCAVGDRALIVCPPGLPYVTAFLGCLYAGVIAVPAYPPAPRRPQRLLAIVRDAQARVMISDTKTILALAPLREREPELRALEWLAHDEVSDDDAESWRPVDLAPARPALLQYTSGSTGTPKGVVLTHRNLVANSEVSRAIHPALATDHYTGVYWVPPYHDMGIMGGIVYPLYSGYRALLVSPLTFLQRPLSLLQAMTHHRAELSPGPNFAYELMCEMPITEQEFAALDLSHWILALNGAEPVRASTMERFVRRFAPRGLRRDVFLPSYGLAESTVWVTGGTDATVLEVDEAELRSGHVVLDAPAGAPTRHLVSSGRAAHPDHRVVIVHPETRQVCGDLEVGEIWVDGPSVAAGYWNQPEATEEVFGARLAGDAARYLRTGDLGFSFRGELFCSGRRKELIIVRGRNFYPHDLELTVQDSHPALRGMMGAAFSIDFDGEERLGIVQEVRRDQIRELDSDAVILAVQRAIAEHYELELHRIALVKPASIPRTSSGKVQRLVCRDQQATGELALIAERTFEPGAPSGDAPLAAWREPLLAMPPDARRPWLEDRIVDEVARLTGSERSTIDVRAQLVQLGMSSLAAVKLRDLAARALGVELAATLVWRFPTISELAGHLLAELAGAGAPPAPPPPAVARPASSLLVDEIAEMSDEEVARRLRERVRA